MNTRLDQTDQFATIGTDGSIYELIEITTMTEHQPVTGFAQWLPGSKEYQLYDGSAVNPRSDGTFEIFETGVILRRT